MKSLDGIISRGYKMKGFVESKIPGPYGHKINLLDIILDHNVGSYLRYHPEILDAYSRELFKLFNDDEIDISTYKELLDIDKLSFKDFYSLLGCRIEISKGKIFSDEIHIIYPSKFENLCEIINNIFISAIEFYSNKIVNDCVLYSIRSAFAALTFSGLFHEINRIASENGLPGIYIHSLDLALFSLLAPGYFSLIGDFLESLHHSYKERRLRIKLQSLKEYGDVTKKLAPFYFLYDSTVGFVTGIGIEIMKNFLNLSNFTGAVFSRYLNYLIFFSTVNQLYAKYESFKKKVSSFISNYITNKFNNLVKRVIY